MRGGLCYWFGLKNGIFLTGSVFPAAAKMAELLTAFVRHRHFRRAAAGKAESVRNISIFSGLTCKNPRPGQTDGRQEINRSGASGDGRGAWGYDEGQKDKDKRDKGKR